MMIWPWVSVRPGAGLEIEMFPNIIAWHARVAERPAVKQALAQAGPAVRASAAQPGPEGDRARSLLFGQRARR